MARENFCRSSRANTRRQACAHIKREKKKVSVNAGSQEGKGNTPGSKQHSLTCRATFSPFPVTMCAFFFFKFQSRSLTSADHFSVRRESQPACPRSGINAILHIMQIRLRSEDWERVLQSRRGVDDNEGR